jgi:hypothetical protein
MPADMEMVPISPTIGRDQLVDEMVVKFTDSVEMDWMLPGIPPTGLRLEVPLVVIVRFQGANSLTSGNPMFLLAHQPRHLLICLLCQVQAHPQRADISNA